MSFPLDFWAISLWLAITSVILLITSEMLSQYYGKINIRIDRKKLRNVALAVSIFFLITVAIRIAMIVLNV